MSEEAFDTWEDFFQETSAALNVKTDAYRAWDVCMCHRKSKQPFVTTEQRTFTYQDVQVLTLVLCVDSLVFSALCFARPAVRKHVPHKVPTSPRMFSWITYAGSTSRASIFAVYHRGNRSAVCCSRRCGATSHAPQMPLHCIPGSRHLYPRLFQANLNSIL